MAKRPGFHSGNRSSILRRGTHITRECRKAGAVSCKDGRVGALPTISTTANGRMAKRQRHSAATRRSPVRLWVRPRYLFCRIAHLAVGPVLHAGRAEFDSLILYQRRFCKKRPWLPGVCSLASTRIVAECSRSRPTLRASSNGKT